MREESRAMRTVCALLGACLLFSAAPVQADDVPDSATIRAKLAAAAGPTPDAFRETYETTSSDGTTMVDQYLRLGADHRDIVQTGPFHTERGVAGGQAWHQNDNGQTVLDQPDPGQATRETTTTTVSRTSAPVAGYVVAVLNAKGFGVKDYVDGATWRLVRRETISANGTVATAYDDFRPDGGRTFAHHWHTDNGYAKTTSDTRVTAYAVGTVSAADVAVAPPRRALVSFPAGVASVVLPAQFGRSHVDVRVTVAGRGLDFILDTGASGIVMDREVAHELGLREYGTRSAVIAGRYTTARTIVPELRVGELTMRDVAVQLVPQGWNTDPGVKEVGLLGFDFLAELGLTIDYEHQRVTAVPGSAFAAPADPHAIPLDVRIGSGQPNVSVTVNGALGERWIIDTGGAGNFLIFDYFARRHPEALRDEGTIGIPRMTFRGIGGEFDTRAYKIGSLQVGNVRFVDFIGYRVISSGSYAGTSDGVIGPGFLRYFTLALDYGASRLYLVPNGEGRRAMGLRD